jgi:O-antigen/teichoic acid export membrane protein
MLMLSLIAGGINYASNLVFGRLLSPAEFGDLTALLALSVIAAVPASAAQTRMAERLATHRARGDLNTATYSIRHGVAHVGVYAVGAGLLALALSPVIERALTLRAIGPALAFSPFLIATFLTPLAQGVLQGLERFLALGLLLIGIAVSRLAFGSAWAVAGGGSGGALLGQAIGTIAALAAIALLVRREAAPAGRGAATAGIKRRIDADALGAAWAFVAFALLSNLDVLLAKLVLSPDQSGRYAALTTIGKIVLFLPTAIAVVMVPRAARQRERGNSTSRELRLAALMTFVIAAVAAAVALASPTLLLRLMFGDRYLDASGGVLPIVVNGAGLSLLYLLVVYTVTIQDKRWSWLLLAGVGAQIVAILPCHTPAQVATAQASVIWGTLLVNEVFFHPLVTAGRWAGRLRKETLA